MDKNEMRLIRRDIINECLQFFDISARGFGMSKNFIVSQKIVKSFVRQQEKANYGMELKAYG